MRRYTTPTIELTVEGVDLTSYTVYASFVQGRHSLDVEGAECALDEEGNTIVTVPLTQLQTAGFQEGSAKVQVNWLDLEGNRNATTIGKISIEANLIEKEL